MLTNSIKAIMAEPSAYLFGSSTASFHKIITFNAAGIKLYSLDFGDADDDELQLALVFKTKECGTNDEMLCLSTIKYVLLFFFICNNKQYLQ